MTNKAAMTHFKVGQQIVYLVCGNNAITLSGTITQIKHFPHHTYAYIRLANGEKKLVCLR